MKDIEILNYFRKNIDLNKFLKFLGGKPHKSGAPDGSIEINLVISCASKQNIELRNECENFKVKKNDKWIPDEEECCEQIISTKLNDLSLKSDKFIFNGTLLPKISKNFKLKFHFEFYGNEDICPNNSHSLIESKINSRCYHIHCIRVPDDKKNIYVLSDFYLVSITKNKISTKRKFFEMIVSYNKKNKIHKFKRMYNSKNGNYLDMYNQNKV